MKRELKEKDVGIFIPFIGILPVELVETFPFSQYVFSNVIKEELIDLVSKDVKSFITKNRYEKIRLYYLDSDIHYKQKMNKIESLIKQLVQDVQTIDLNNL